MIKYRITCTFYRKLGTGKKVNSTYDRYSKSGIYIVQVTRYRITGTL